MYVGKGEVQDESTGEYIVVEDPKYA